MLKLFRKKSKAEKLEAKYMKLLSEVHQLSKTNRKASDAKQQEAEKVLEEITALD